ncbi:MAG: methionyl-tRNA formyltransferase [Defluviitaleaceae bacterium]|nr:methionyl-tRNA formyltransferase [Defluviitaleaceae bacterium]
MKIVFMGTPEFSVPTLLALSKHHEVVAVITQPDRKKGRGKQMQAPPVKELALELSIPVLQPEKIKNAEFVKILKEIEADIFVVVAYGQLLSQEILDMPRLGCINIHASLLPKYRGPAPINYAILNGDKTTGITIMQMDLGLDTGDILLKEEIKIEEDDTSETLYTKLSGLGSKSVITALKSIENGSIIREKQDDSVSSYAPMLTKEIGKIDFSKTTEEILNLIRGLQPWPSAYTSLNGNVLKIFEASMIEQSYDGKFGEIVEINSHGIYVKTVNSAIIIKELQPQGKKRMKTSDFLNGTSIKLGDTFT